MPQFEYRQLTSDDSRDLHKLIRSHTRVQRTEYDTSSIDVRSDVNNFVGSFVEGELIGVLRATPWEKMNFYSIGALYLKPGLLQYFTWDPTKNPAIGMLNFAISKMESDGRFDWYYTRAIDNWPGRMMKDGRDFFSSSDLNVKYDRYIQEVIPSESRSRFELHDNLCLSRTWKVDIAIFKCSMKNPLRNFRYKLENEL